MRNGRATGGRADHNFGRRALAGGAGRRTGERNDKRWPPSDTLCWAIAVCGSGVYLGCGRDAMGSGELPSREEVLGGTGARRRGWCPLLLSTRQHPRCRGRRGRGVAPCRAVGRDGECSYFLGKVATARAAASGAPCRGSQRRNRRPSHEKTALTNDPPARAPVMMASSRAQSQPTKCQWLEGRRSAIASGRAAQKRATGLTTWRKTLGSLFHRRVLV